MAILEELQKIKQESFGQIDNADTISALENIRIEYLGKKGILTNLLHQIGIVSKEERPILGKEGNILKNSLQSYLEEKLKKLVQIEEEKSLASSSLDTTLPGTSHNIGHIHPLTQTMMEIIDIFTGLGFEIAEGPEIETEYYNFDALNFQKNHPARDMQDTFFLENNLLLRTHTSPVQVRTMEQRKPPLKVIAPGKVYRCDADVCHSPIFHQIEGFMVDYNINFSHLKGTLSTFLTHVFGEKTKVRFRPSFFPFTEPSAEVDISCIICGAKGCPACKQTGWMEILGAGMIHPNVFKSAGYPEDTYTGFAFGLGIERITMLKYGIHDIRMFYENDMRFLKQF
jgi:phenylalanyl-tRNA synthetase alpha chain